MKSKIILISLISILLWNCSSNKKSVTDEQVAPYISTVTQGKVSPETKITINFVNDMVTQDQLNTPLTESPLKISPKIDGEIKWISTKKLVFQPSEKLAYGKSYKVVLDLQKLPGNVIPVELLQYIFVLDVKQNSIAMFTADIDTKSPSSPKILQYKVDFGFASPVTKADVEKGISLTLDNKSVEYALTEKEDGMEYRLVSSDIVRDDASHMLKFVFDKFVFGFDDDIVKSQQITPLSEFKVTDLIADKNGKNPKIRVVFSDKISMQQNIDGLISVDPMPGALKLQRLGNSVIVEGDFKFGNDYKVIVQKHIESVWGTKTKNVFTQKISLPDIEPQAEFASAGFILPSENNFIVQFYSCNLTRVHLELKKVYNDDLDEFIRNEQLSSQVNRKARFANNYESNMGVILYNQELEISNQKNSWKLSEIDLSKVIKEHGKGMYLIRLNFNPQDILTQVEDTYQFINQNGQIYKPIIMSDIGLMCKRADNNYVVMATDLNTAKPLSDVNITMKRSYYNNEKYTLSGTTNENGMVTLYPDREYYYYEYILAQKGDDRTILKFDESEWNISGYDIGGLDSDELNTQAFAYTERGVYRPGDEINLSIIARHLNSTFPDNKTVTVDLSDPMDKTLYSVTSKENTNGFFSFKFQTQQSDPTGNWTARFNIGNRYFYHTIKVETVVPYKLKTNITLPKTTLYKADKKLHVDVDCKYLFGMPAGGNPIELVAEYSNLNLRFPKYSDFSFTNPTIEFSDISNKLDDAEFDKDGLYSNDIEIPEFAGVPSALNLKLSANVMEKGGRKNNNWVNVKINPYDAYVGIKNLDGYYKTETDLSIPVVLVNPEGEPIEGKKLRYNIYKNEEYWWWQYDNRQLRYKSNSHTTLVKQGELISGEQQSIIRFMPVDRGSYYVEVYNDEDGGHSVGEFFSAYCWSSSSQGDNSAGMLMLSSNKDKYLVGETAKISFPSPGTGRVLVSVEKDDQILSTNWYQPEESEQMTIEVPITEQMTPNAYVSIMLLQPHAETKNDRPLRMFGVLPINVVNPDSKFDIKINTKESFRPEEPFEVEIQTSNYRQTQYTIAVVDEGLLDLTRFQTPNPWKYFFRKIRLGVRTFDVFSQVISANIGDVFKTFSIGGDMDYRKSQLEPDSKKKRFEPVSLFEGPLETDANGYAKLKFDMPNYVGSVRIMVVAANHKRYASAEKTVPVKKELMVLPTLPRVIGPGEEFAVPATVFAMEDNIGNVKVSIATEGPIDVIGSKQLSLNFAKKGDADCSFKLKTRNAAGQSKVTITVTNGTYSANNETNLNVRPSSPRNYVTSTKEFTPGNEVTFEVPATGIDGTNRASIMVAGYPGMNFKHRLYWLIHYPYGCVEQTTSSVFPQLYLKKFIEFTPAEEREIDENINAGIQRLNRFQLYSGGLSYWPGGSENCPWGTVYAAHFLVEARKLGYYVPDALYDGVINYMKNSIRSLDNYTTKVYYSYVLALSSNPVTSELNVLAESYLSELSNSNRWMLAAACHLAGMDDVAQNIAKHSDVNVPDYIEFSGTYGSSLRDKAMILDAMVTLGKMDKAFDLMKELSMAMDNKRWYSTQTISYTLLATGRYIAKLVDKDQDPLVKGTLFFPDGTTKAFSTKSCTEIRLDNYIGQKVRLKMDDATTFSKVFGIMNTDGVPLKSELKDTSMNLSLQVKYYDENGAVISTERLTQGTSFWIHLHAENKTTDRVDEVALMYMLPSGWELQNTRLQTEVTPSFFSNLKLNKEEYVDMRDDRIIWFFDMSQKNKYYDYHQYDFIAKINVVTVGKFELPPILLEAMYNNNYKAVVAGKSVEVDER